MSFDELYNRLLNHKPYDFPENPLGFSKEGENLSDISAHMPMLTFLAAQCNSVAEFGVRDCYSTVAILKGLHPIGRLFSYDINKSANVEYLESIQKPAHWSFHQKNTISGDWVIPPVSMLFVDSLHTYHQVKEELKIHAIRVFRYLVFHDTFSHGKNSRDIQGEEGISRAIEEFLQDNPKWKKVYEVQFNHGLIVLGKTDEFN